MEACVDWICFVKVSDMADKRASFWGFGGIGGGAMLVAGAGIAVSNGDVKRSSGGLVLSCCGVLGGYC